MLQAHRIETASAHRERRKAKMTPEDLTAVCRLANASFTRAASFRSHAALADFTAAGYAIEAAKEAEPVNLWRHMWSEHRVDAAIARECGALNRADHYIALAEIEEDDAAFWCCRATDIANALVSIPR